MHNERNKVEQEHFSQKQKTGECFTTKLESTCKNSGTCEEKILPKKVTYFRSVSHQAIQLVIKDNTQKDKLQRYMSVTALRYGNYMLL